MDVTGQELFSPNPRIGSSTPVYFIQQLLDFTQAYVMIVVLLLGIFGNTLSFVIFLRVRKRADACVQYLSCLAVSDTGVILIIGVTDWFAFGLKHITNGEYGFNLISYSDASCKSVSGVWHFFEVISAWIIVAFSAERAYVVWFPLKRANITPKLRKIVLFTIVLGAVLLCIQRFWLMENTQGTPSLCFYKTDPVLSAVLWQVDISAYAYVPFFLIVQANVFILVAVNFSKNNKLGSNKGKTIQEGKLLVSLMSVSTLYIALVLPAAAIFTYLSQAAGTLGEDRALFLWFMVKFLTLISVNNYCFNFIIYGCTLPFYREEVKRMFSRNRQS
ncbi:FMRFamide peptide receptor frpr-18-like isoform X1 [Lineus longissimus]|uniref:FMRFamide peptide receptor frpr-18-like isoform X1 n=1 Tax=Lineus longissimus TaxID=88925 RepID=UPI00315D5FC6